MIPMPLLQKLRKPTAHIILLIISSSCYIQAQHMEVSGNTLTIPIEPTHVGAIDDDGTTELGGARSIYVYGKYAYIASSGFFNDGVEILDISDPANPTHVGKIVENTTTILNGVSSIYVSGKYAYVATSSIVEDGVEILDISDPTNPTHVGAITDDGTTALDGAKSIYVSGKYAYVASNDDDGVEILDISDPTNPTHVGAITDDDSTALDGANSIYVSGKYAYVASYDDGVEILDISDPTNPTHVGAIADNFKTKLNGAISIYVSGKYAYVASIVDNGVEILDISGIDAPSGHIGALAVSTLDISDKAQVGDDLHVAGSIHVGHRGLHSTGSISTSGGLNVNSRVGIGTKSPDQLLTISAPDEPILRFDRSGVGTWDWELYSAAGGGLHFRGGSNDVGAGLTDLVTFGGNGNVEVKGVVLANATPGPSDIRYKKDVRSLENSLDKISQLRGVSYDWKQEEFPNRNFTSQRQQGFIAQELEEIFPSMVYTDERGYKSVEYAKVTPVLVEAVKALIKINEVQQDKIDYLEEQVSAIDKLKQEIEAIKKAVNLEKNTVMKSF